jgi:hypothetical protein
VQAGAAQVDGFEVVADKHVMNDHSQTIAPVISSTRVYLRGCGERQPFWVRVIFALKPSVSGILGKGFPDFLYRESGHDAIGWVHWGWICYACLTAGDDDAADITCTQSRPKDLRESVRRKT